MVLLLTTRPRQGLALRLPPWWAWPAAVALAVLLLPPFVSLTLILLDQFPHLKHTLLEAQGASGGNEAASHAGPGLYTLVLGVLPAVCEELAFRGFILSGLRRRFRPWTAILLSGFLYALYQMNVFQAVPHFLAGAVLALLVVRTNSVLPAMVFHLVWNVLLLLPGFQPKLLEHINDALSGRPLLGSVLVLACLVLAAPLLASLLRRPSLGIRLRARGSAGISRAGNSG
jgi:sodium transport system permease protein